tara:strand:- start:1327 stop:3864 length:2538 start_codon:yes stop_codon:yes gene_type:complete
MVMILDRPIFRQQGGPIMDAPMPPDPQMQAPMPPDPQMQEALQAVESQASAEGEQIGQEYLQGINSLLDGAENYEEMINAMRGNALPLQARYNELADFVGEADASSTPESVLTLVQPTIMMSEEGAVDSGVGSLMQEVVGGMGMEEQPQMTQGLGELMVAGQPPMPPPQNFASGGPVKHFASAGPVNFGDEDAIARIMQQGLDPARSFEEIYKEREPFYESILGSPEDRDAASKRQMMLDISSAGFNLAAGIDPRTGKNMAGQPFLSQVGTALSGMPERAGERLAQRRKADQAAKLGALRSAETSQLAESQQATAQATSLATLAAGRQSQTDRIASAEFQQLNAHEQQKVMAKLNADINEARDKMLFGQERILLRTKYQYERSMLAKSHENRLEVLDRTFEGQAGLDAQAQGAAMNQIHARGSIQAALQDDSQEHSLEAQKRQNAFLEDMKEKDRELIEERLELDVLEYELRKGLAPSIEKSWLPWDKSQADQLNEIRIEREKLQNEAIEQGIDLGQYASDFNSFIQTERLHMDARAQDERRLLEYYSMLDDGADFSDTGFVKNLLGDGNAARAYASGVAMPQYEVALTSAYKPQVDLDTGRMSSPQLPTHIESALRLRQQKGYAVPSGFLNLQAGGPVNQPEGMYREPVTGGMLRRPPLDAPEPYPQQPLITDLPPGMDITKGTGSAVTPVLHRFLEPLVGVAGDIAGGQDWKLDEETTEAVSAINALNQMATMRTMQSLAGRESVQLMERIASLQVPAAEFFYDDTKALSQFKTASRIMDYAVREQERLMSLGLPRKDRIQAEKELTSLRGLQAEYDNVVGLYERKLGRTDKDWNTALDQFFK